LASLINATEKALLVRWCANPNPIIIIIIIIIIINAIMIFHDREPHSTNGTYVDTLRLEGKRRNESQLTPCTTIKQPTTKKQQPIHNNN